MAALHALLGFTGWTLLLIVIVFSYRGARLLTGTKINSWSRRDNTANDSAFALRVADAHANCIENLLPFAAVVLTAQALGKAELIGAAAAWVLYARVGQSLVHLVGTSQILVLVRATFWSIQLGLMFWMLWQLFA